jgi:hypothetical protein
MSGLVSGCLRSTARNGSELPRLVHTGLGSMLDSLCRAPLFRPIQHPKVRTNSPIYQIVTSMLGLRGLIVALNRKRATELGEHAC